jgi:hypothetical protein
MKYIREFILKHLSDDNAQDIFFPIVTSIYSAYFSIHRTYLYDTCKEIFSPLLFSKQNYLSFSRFLCGVQNYFFGLFNRKNFFLHYIYNKYKGSKLQPSFQTSAIKIGCRFRWFSSELVRIKYQFWRIPTESVRIECQFRWIPTESIEIWCQFRWIPTESVEIGYQFRWIPTESVRIGYKCRRIPTESVGIGCQCRWIPSESIRTESQCRWIPSESAKIKCHLQSIPSELPEMEGLISNNANRNKK